MGDPHIHTQNAWVEFPIFDAKSRSLKKAFLGKAGGTIGRNESNVVVIEALRDITMSLEMGDRVGLVGHNGAGKSTLLRLLSGIYEPTRGSATVRGRVAPVFDLGVGMDPEISGFENIVIRGDVPWPDAQADGGEGRRNRRLHRTRRLPVDAAAHLLEPACGYVWRWAW